MNNTRSSIFRQPKIGKYKGLVTSFLSYLKPKKRSPLRDLPHYYTICIISIIRVAEIYIVPDTSI